MARRTVNSRSAPPALPRTLRKKATGITGFDQITGGGLPEGRMSAIIGGPGTGKSLFGAQYLHHRYVSEGEPGILVSFEESPDRIAANLASLSWDIEQFPDGALTIIDARLDRNVELAGDFDLSALLATLSARIRDSGARHVVFDGVDTLIDALVDYQRERREITRIDDWVRDEGVTGILTVKIDGGGESGARRGDLIQYVTDAVILIENVLHAADLSRTLRIVKYRGSGFSANAVPLVIGSSGIQIIPSGTGREGFPVFEERLSTGIDRLDAYLGGGPIRGSSMLVTGAPGTAKTSLAASIVAATCLSGARAVFVSFDESDTQIVANMKSIGIDLARHVKSGRLRMLSLTSHGQSPEECFLRIAEALSEHRPALLVVDPMSSFSRSGYTFATAIAESLINHAKSRGITFVGTSLLSQGDGWTEESASHVSTIADLWIHLAYVAQKGERNRALTIVKARGTDHSNQVRELSLGAKGIDLMDVFAGEGEVLFGSARVEKLRQEKRRDMLEQITARRRKLDASNALAELELRVKSAMQELEAKRLEMELDAAADRAGEQDRDDASRERRQMRREGDDLSEPRRRKRMAG